MFTSNPNGVIYAHASDVLAPTGETNMDTYLFQRADGSLVEVNATCYVAAQEIAGDDALCVASGSEAVAAYDAVYKGAK